MKILNLGRIIFFSILPIFIYAQVSVSLDKIAVLEGESVVMSITASGSDIKLPKLKTIEGNKILATSTSSSINIINGKMTRSKTVNYQFVPEYTFNIPIYSVIIDGFEHRTEEIKLKVIRPMSSKNGDDFQLKIKFAKEKLYVGEDVIVSMIFKYKVGLQVLNLNLDEFIVKHFVMKPLKQKDTYEKDGFIIIEQDFVLFPQLAGNYVIDKQVISVKTREAKTNQLYWKKVFSNESKIEVLSLPNNINIQGDFKITAKIDKAQTKMNEAINLTLEINGAGNIDDIDEFKLDMPDVVSYSSKPIISAKIINKRYSGKFKQKFSLIADKDFIIEPIEFSYFDIKSKMIKTIKTKAIKVKVKGEKKQAPLIQTTNINENTKISQSNKNDFTNNENENLKYIFLILGFFVGIIITLIVKRKRTTNEEEKTLENKIKKSKNNDELYKILLPYSFNEKVVGVLTKLEENIYAKKQIKINKKELITTLEDENLK